MKHPTHLSLNAKLILLISSIAIALLFCVISVDYIRTMRSVPYVASGYADQISDRTAKSLQYPVWNMSWGSAEEIIRIELSAPYLSCLVFQEKEPLGTTIGFRKQDDQLTSANSCMNPDNKYVTRTTQVSMRDSVIGEIRLAVDLDYFRSQALTRLRVVLIEGFSLILILSITVYIFMNKYFLKPLHGLEETTCLVTHTQDFSLRAWHPSQDEIGRLATSFNTMLNEIEKRDNKLKSHSQNLEDIVARRTAELAEQTLELEEANKRLLELDKLKSELLSTVSHDMRTPLTSIIGFAKLVKKDLSIISKTITQEDETVLRRSDRSLTNLDIICKEGKRLTRLINDFLDLSRIESGKMEWQDTEVVPGLLVDIAVEAVHGEYEALDDVALVVEMEENLPTLNCCIDRIVQVLINLLNNAAKFTNRGTVTICVARHDDMVRFSVKDTGKGVTEVNLEKIFDKFYKIEGSDTLDAGLPPRGSGLGLAICREIVQHYEGRIWAESEVGKGSVFYFELPALIRENS